MMEERIRFADTGVHDEDTILQGNSGCYAEAVRHAKAPRTKSNSKKGKAVPNSGTESDDNESLVPSTGKKRQHQSSGKGKRMSSVRVMGIIDDDCEDKKMAPSLIWYVCHV